MDILDIVSNRPSNEKRKNAVVCPYCDSIDVSKYGTISTSVGYVGVDRNHKWTECYCNDCEKKFTRESKGPNSVWYVDKDKNILKGIPTCFEDYTYQCAKCGGEVKRSYFKVGTNEPVFSLTSGLDENGNWVKYYRTEYRCIKCGYGGEVKEDYYKEG